MYQSTYNNEDTEAAKLLGRESSEKTVGHGVNFARAKDCFECSVYCRIAAGEGSVLILVMILFLQLFSPLRIAVMNSVHLEDCFSFNQGGMPWDTHFQNTLFVVLVWQAIVNDTERSISGFEFASGLQNLPSKWVVWLGLLLTPVVNSMTGVAATFILLDPEIKIVEAAINSFALLFLNRLDDDFGALDDVFQIALSPEEGMDPEEEDEQVAERYLESFGPWNDPYQSHNKLENLGHHFVTYATRVIWFFSVALPFVFMMCAF